MMNAVILMVICFAAVQSISAAIRNDITGLRLLNGSDSCSGTPEILYKGSWKRICHKALNYRNVMVMCRQLNCGNVVTVIHKPTSVEHKDYKELLYANCEGSEATLNDCELKKNERCFDYLPSVINCSDSVRLVDGEGFCSGRVEIKSHQSWSKVCQSDFDWQDGEVVCRELGCGSPLSLFKALYEEGKGPVRTKEFRCEGTESRLLNCTTSTIDKQTCTSSAVGLTCAEPEKVRLVGGSSKCDGVVEMFHNDAWIKVSFWNVMESSSLVCRQLDCGSVISSFWGSADERRIGIFVRCQGNESELSDCKFPDGDFFGYNREVICSDSVRMVDGDGLCSGRVEIKSHQSWSTVCESDFDWQDAEVVCREMGCGNPLALQGALYGEGKGPTGTKEFGCEGTESHLLNCKTSTRDEQTCIRPSAVGVNCSDLVGIRTVNEKSRCAGFLELHYQKQLWGVGVIRRIEAEMVCRHLGCGSLVVFSNIRNFNSRKMSIQCNGSDSELNECSFTRDDRWEMRSAYVFCSGLLNQPNISFSTSERVSGDSQRPKLIRGHNFTITCSVDPQYPEGTVYLSVPWSSKNYALPAVNQSASFFFPSADDSHQGNYRCIHQYQINFSENKKVKYENYFGPLVHTFSSESEPLSLVFTEPLNQPNISFSTPVSVSGGPQEPQVFRGHNFTITCSIDPQYPEGTIYLSVPWSNRSHARPVVNHSASFFFPLANDSHQGNYSCSHQYRMNFGEYEKVRYGNGFGPLVHTSSSESEPLSLVVTDSALTVKIIRIVLKPVYYLTFWLCS